MDPCPFVKVLVGGLALRIEELFLPQGFESAAGHYGLHRPAGFELRYELGKGAGQILGSFGLGGSPREAGRVPQRVGVYWEKLSRRFESGTSASLERPGRAISFLLLAYANYLGHSSQVVHCGSIAVTPARLRAVAKSQVDYILGDNPMKLSYMVGYGSGFPKYIHHRGSSLPSVTHHPSHITCKGGSQYFFSKSPNPNLLVGAVVGGPNTRDQYSDARTYFRQSEPTTYINAPLDLMYYAVDLMYYAVDLMYYGGALKIPISINLLF